MWVSPTEFRRLCFLGISMPSGFLFSWCPLFSLALTIFLLSLNQNSLSPQGRSLIETSHQDRVFQVLSFSAHCLVVGRVAVPSSTVGTFFDEGRERH